MSLIQGAAKISTCNQIQTEELPIKTSAIPYGRDVFQKENYNKYVEHIFIMQTRRFRIKTGAYIRTKNSDMLQKTSSCPSSPAPNTTQWADDDNPLHRVSPIITGTNNFGDKKCSFIIHTSGNLSIITHSYVNILSTETTAVSLKTATGSDIRCYW